MCALARCQTLTPLTSEMSYSIRSGIEYAVMHVHQLDKYLECILIDKANSGSDFLHRITNLKKHGWIRMYAAVYKWFTETSGLGLT